MSRDNSLSIGELAERVGLRKKVIRQRIERGEIKSTANGLRIPLAEVERIDAAIKTDAAARQAQLQTMQLMSREIDDYLNRASAVIHKAASTIIGHAVGTKKWHDALDALRKGIAAYDSAYEMQVPYLAAADKVEREGLDWLRQFDGQNVEPDAEEAPAGGR